MTIASQEYREEFDLIGRFIDDCCDTSNPHSRIKSSQLYQAYEKWTDTVGEFKHGNKQFSTELLRKGFEKAKNGCIFWHGISLSESYQRWDLEGLEGQMHKPQENDSYGLTKNITVVNQQAHRSHGSFLCSVSERSQDSNSKSFPVTL